MFKLNRVGVALPGKTRVLSTAGVCEGLLTALTRSGATQLLLIQLKLEDTPYPHSHTVTAPE